MFRFNRIAFIISNFLVSFGGFLLIFNLRYKWLFFPGIEQRALSSSALILLVLYSLTIVIFNISFKVYEVNKISLIAESLLLNIMISMLSMGVFGIYFFLTKTNFARFVFFTGFLTIPLILTVFNKLIYVFTVRNRKPAKILYFGGKANLLLFRSLINEYNKWFPMKLDNAATSGSPEDLKKKIRRNEILIVDTDRNFKKEFVEILNAYEIDGGKIYSLIDLYSYFDQSLPAEIISNNHYDLFSSYKIDSFYNRYIKRIGDILISIMFILILLPVIIITALLVKITSKGSVLYKQKRLTINGKEFHMYKFRSMKHSAENNGAQLAKRRDDRVTLLGKIIRPLRIDEIPQLINILRGDMSFIGPRPERPEMVEKIIQKFPLFKKRLLIKPGLTGWAQVKYTYVNKIENMNKKLSYDLFYLNHISFIFDLKILLYTIETVLFRRGAL